MKLSKGQQMMVDDGLPAECCIPQEERAAAVRSAPVKDKGIFFDPKEEERKKLAEQFKIEQMLKRPVKPIKQAFDPRGMRWNPRLNKWTPDPTATQEENMSKPKYKIMCYNVDNLEIKRGTTSCPADVTQVELLAKMGAALHRCAEGVVEKVHVTDDDGATIREWIKGEAELPKPEKEPEPPQMVTPNKAKGKPAPKPAKGAAKKAAAKPKSDKPKGPGVIATIVEIISGPKGATLEEAIAKMVKIFPDREVKGMTSTFRIQANKFATSKVKDEKRGLVYHCKAK